MDFSSCTYVELHVLRLALAHAAASHSVSSIAVRLLAQADHEHSMRKYSTLIGIAPKASPGVTP